MADCALPACDRPAPDAWVCAPCAATIAGRLQAAAELWPELLTTCAGQARMGEPGPRARGHAPPQPIRPGLGDPAQDHQGGWPSGLPVPLSAVQVRDDVRNTATTWARVIWEELALAVILGPACAECNHRTCRRIMRQPSAPVPSTAWLLRWLAGQCEWLRHQRWGVEALDELNDAARLVAPAVDRPAMRVDAGLCLAPTQAGPCQQRLSAAPAAAYVHCPGCRTTWSATERSEIILAAAADMLGTAAEVSAWLTIHGEPCPTGTIYSWASRRRLLKHGRDPETGQPWYRLGDVRRLAAERRGSRTEVAA